MRSFTTVDLNKRVGDITEAARKEPVVITHHKKPKFVLMSMEAYEGLTHAPADDPRRAYTVEELPDHIADGILALADEYEAADRDGQS